MLITRVDCAGDRACRSADRPARPRSSQSSSGTGPGTGNGRTHGLGVIVGAPQHRPRVKRYRLGQRPPHDAGNADVYDAGTQARHRPWSIKSAAPRTLWTLPRYKVGTNPTDRHSSTTNWLNSGARPIRGEQQRLLGKHRYRHLPPAPRRDGRRRPEPRAGRGALARRPRTRGRAMHARSRRPSGHPPGT